MIRYLFGFTIGMLLAHIIYIDKGNAMLDRHTEVLIETASLFYYIGCYEASQPLTEAKLAECRAKQKRIIEEYSSILK